RWVVDAIYMHGPEITVSDLQGAGPVLRHLDLFLGLGRSVASVREAKELSAMPLDPHEFPYPVLSEADHDGEPALAELRAIVENAPRQRRVRESAREKLARPDGRNPEGFYAQVAQAYWEYATRTRSPAVEIAREAEVPVTTAHRWVREARRRGFLPPGRRGA